MRCMCCKGANTNTPQFPDSPKRQVKTSSTMFTKCQSLLASHTFGE